MRFDLIAVDLDDTLLHSDLSISEANIAALREVHRAGMKIVLASGRNIFSMERYAKELGLHGKDDYIVASNGAEIVETATGRVLHEIRLAPELCREVTHAVESRGFCWQVYSNERILYRGWNEYTEEDTRLTGLPNEPVEDEEALIATGQLKFVVPGDPKVLPGLLTEMQSLLEGKATVLISKPCFLEVLPLGADKGAALTRFCAMSGLDMRRCLAMGDAMNDLTMLKAAGFSCVPANAIPAAKELASFVSELTNDEDFVADALDRFAFLG